MCLLGYLFIGLFPQQAAGDTVSDENYSIDVGNIDTNPQPTTKPEILGSQNQQPKSPFTTGPNYTVNASLDSLSFKTSQMNIDYGIVSVTNPVIRTVAISVTNPDHGAQVFASEDHPLFDQANITIPDTTCDNGACTQSIAALWNSTLTYGFGYRCDSTISNVCDKQFSISNAFKQYADTSKNEQMQIILANDVLGKDISATITNKLNISGTQKSGNYINSITYLAVPNF